MLSIIKVIHLFKQLRKTRKVMAGRTKSRVLLSYGKHEGLRIVDELRLALKLAAAVVSGRSSG
jgi:hypothetical protein